MRPKIVILTLLLAAGTIALLGVLRGVRSKPEAQSQPTGSSGVPGDTTVKPVAVPAAPKPAVTNVIASTPDEDRAAQKQKDLEALNDALVAGADDPRSVLEVASRLENSDSEVRAAARQTALHLGDTNVIPYLNIALVNIQDPREKVAIMDAINFLQLPSALDDATNSVEVPPRRDGSAPTMVPPRRKATPKAN